MLKCGPWQAAHDAPVGGPALMNSQTTVIGISGWKRGRERKSKNEKWGNRDKDLSGGGSSGAGWGWWLCNQNSLYTCVTFPKIKQLNIEFHLLGSALSCLQVDFSKGNLRQIALAKRLCQLFQKNQELELSGAVMGSQEVAESGRSEQFFLQKTYQVTSINSSRRHGYCKTKSKQNKNTQLNIQCCQSGRESLTAKHLMDD